jgi:hypothetical protein
MKYFIFGTKRSISSNLRPSKLVPGLGPNRSSPPSTWVQVSLMERRPTIACASKAMIEDRTFYLLTGFIPATDFAL